MLSITQVVYFLTRENIKENICVCTLIRYKKIRECPQNVKKCTFSSNAFSVNQNFFVVATRTQTQLLVLIQSTSQAGICCCHITEKYHDKSFTHLFLQCSQQSEWRVQIPFYLSRSISADKGYFILFSSASSETRRKRYVFQIIPFTKTGLSLTPGLPVGGSVDQKINTINLNELVFSSISFCSDREFVTCVKNAMAKHYRYIRINGLIS